MAIKANSTQHVSWGTITTLHLHSGSIIKLFASKKKLTVSIVRAVRKDRSGTTRLHAWVAKHPGSKSTFIKGSLATHIHMADQVITYFRKEDK